MKNDTQKYILAALIVAFAVIAVSVIARSGDGEIDFIGKISDPKYQVRCTAVVDVFPFTTPKIYSANCINTNSECSLFSKLNPFSVFSGTSGNVIFASTDDKAIADYSAITGKDTTQATLCTNQRTIAVSLTNEDDEILETKQVAVQ